MTNRNIYSGRRTDEIKALKQRGGDPLRCIGSISLVKSMVELGLTDRLRLMVFPLILGDAGREPIFANYPLEHLELISTKVLDRDAPLYLDDSRIAVRSPVRVGLFKPPLLSGLALRVKHSSLTPPSFIADSGSMS